MRRLSFLLRPGWLGLVAGVLIFAGACFWVLSPWQFGRNTERQTQINALTHAQGKAPEALDQFLPGNVEPTAKQEWYQVTMTGHYLTGDDVVVLLREIDSCSDCDPSPAFEILTPFHEDNGTNVLVDRGYVPPGSFDQVPRYAAAPAGHVTLTARVHPDEAVSGRKSLVQNGHREVYDINAKVVGAATGVVMRPGSFALIAGEAGALGIAALPQLDSGPFLSYAWQWITFGVMALGGLGYFTWRELKPGGALTPEGRARRRAEKEALRAEEQDEQQHGRVPQARKKKVRGRHKIALMIAEDEAREQAEADAEANGPHPKAEASGWASQGRG
ncbi:MAG TPA: SURF1 family cytochrome oxidase biogenesis protein [Pseudonocardiaceae bacterium]|nr:SURF1 family cytochrome oxidase biogenesis protein [Pseudonocardiaceae bacterium]